MEIRNVTDVLANELQGSTRDDIATIHFGEADPQDVRSAMDNPRRFADSAGVDTTDESQYHISFMQRQDRHPLAAKARSETRAARRAIVIVIHYRCCCADILILGW